MGGSKSLISGRGMKLLKSAKTKLGNEIELIEHGDAMVGSPLVIGVFHGDEPQGKYLIDEYLKTSPPLPNPLPQGAREYKTCQYSQFSLIKAKELRKSSTDAEKIIWEIVRAKRLDGLKFRRQQPIGKYVVHFVCFEKKLIIELDGGQHNEEKNIVKDTERTNYLQSAGYKVIRFLDYDVINNIEGVYEYIINVISEMNYTPSLTNEIMGDGDIYCSLPPMRGRARERGLLFIPCLNPDGMQLGTRTNANGVDLNRNFPTKNWLYDPSPQPSPTRGEGVNPYFGGESAGSEIETQFVMEILEEYKPSSILSLHAPYKVVNYDGPARELAEEISEIIGYPVEESIGYPTPGSFGTYAGIEKQIPTITLELDETCPVENLVEPVFEVFDLFTV